jgi:hypothetical protein
MTKAQFHRIYACALELVRLKAAGADVDPDLLAWAQELIRLNDRAAPFKPSPNMDKIHEALKDAPLAGYNSREMREKTGIKQSLLAATLSYAAKRGYIAMLKMPRASRFFSNQAALELGRFAAEAEARREETYRLMTKLPEALAKPRHIPSPKPHQAMTVKQQPNVVISPPRKPTINESVFNPHGIKPTVIPTPEDTRYKPDPNGDGAGFMSDWKRRRGEV